jgi:hypothetical protein
MFRSILNFAAPAIACLLTTGGDCHAQQLHEWGFFEVSTEMVWDWVGGRSHTGGLPTPRQVIADMRSEEIDRFFGIRPIHVRRLPQETTEFSGSESMWYYPTDDNFYGNDRPQPSGWIRRPHSYYDAGPNPRYDGNFYDHQYSR